MDFKNKLDTAVIKNDSLVCVGLDPDLDKLPESFKSSENPLFEFCKYIANETYESVCAFKPNSAFFEAFGAKGIQQLKDICDYIKQNHPQIPVILDFKRGDIGNTNAKYAQFAFDYLGVDAVTLQPYQGISELEPFFSYKNKGIFIWAKGSNEGSKEFQDLEIGGKPLYEKVTEAVIKTGKSNALLIVGATYPKELKKIREIAGDEAPILVPGIGAQGGNLEAMLEAGLNSLHKGLIINSSRGVIFSENPKSASEALKRDINLAGK